MAQILIQKVLNNEISTEDLLRWIPDTNIENEKYREISQLCSQKEFVTFFLNVIHDQLLCERSWETPQKPKILTTTPSHSKFKRRSLFSDPKSTENPRIIEPSFLNDSSHHTFNLSCTTSTPKIGKSYSYDCIDEKFSPIHKSSHSFKKGFDNSKSNSLCLGDFIVHSKKFNSKKKVQKNNTDSQNVTPKRINPTNISERKFTDIFTKSENSFNFENSSNNVVVKDEEVNRDFLKKEMEKISTRRNSIDENILEQIKKNTEVKSVKTGIEIFPNPKLVRFKREIEKIIVIYDHLLKNGLVLSFIGELYFIISLLFNKSYCEGFDNVITNGENSSENLIIFQEVFKSIHNIIFFASSMLEKFVFYLRSLDKSTLKYMCELDRLKLYSPHLIKTLEQISELKSDRLLNLYESNGKNNICFVLDTDNRSNFPSDLSFQSFKKQRDLFYEILKIWEDGHMVPGWSFEYSLGRKVRTLLSYHNDPVNFMRLARLFMEQLLSNCGKNAMEQISKETSSSLLTSLANIDRDKFDLLKSRLITKQSSNGINNAPEFTGYQEFYKEFILISTNPSFLKHLCDVFISEITDLNETIFIDLETDSTDETDQETKKAYVNCLKSLRTLAKFLGFVESLPYKYDNCLLSTNLVDLQVKIREQVKPNFDVLHILRKSTSNGTLTLCIPWICKYLSMLDLVTLKTAYFNKIIKIMIELYRNFGDIGSPIPEYNVYLVKYSIGWLFELNNFPHNTFFEMLTSKRDDGVLENSRTAGLDRLKLVDQNILYIFCPYLEEIKKLLTSKTVARDRVSVRHITPLTAVDSPKEVIKRKIENQLEEAFFNGHPTSLKKTVDFIAERIASTCVKHLCYVVVPDFKKKFNKELQAKLREWSSEEMVDLQTILRNKCEKLAEENLKTLENLCGTEVNNIIQNNLRNAVHSLLPMDCLPQMESICVSSAKRMCLGKVKQWTSSHIVIGILSKDIGGEISKSIPADSSKIKPKPAFILPPGGSNVSHNEETESAAHILDRLRDLSVSMLSSTRQLEEEFIFEFLDSTYKTLTQRNDVNDAIHFMICLQLVDFILLLVTFQPSLVRKSQKHFFKIWKLQGDKSGDLFSNLLCQRNIMLLAQAGSKSNESWAAKAELCVAILAEKLLSCECFESQCTGLFKSNLDEETLKNVTNFLRIFVENYKKECRSSKFTFLLEFLSDYCSDL